ncbi:MAG: AraC family transcriptional regulator [Clostridiaceae bacterium]
MKNSYISYGDVQDYIRNYYLKYNKKTTVLEATKTLKVELCKQIFYCNNDLKSPSSWGYLSDEEFISEIFRIPVQRTSVESFTGNIMPEELPERIFFLNDNDVLIFKQFHNIYDPLHSHNFFEIFYVYKGSCELKFENELRTLVDGDLCIIAPGSRHSVIHDDETSIIITISIKKSTFDSSFFQLLTHKDLLSNFFRNILYNNVSSNYILFSTDNPKEIKLIIRSLMFEYNMGDIYSNNCCISWINLLFSLILRNYSDYVQFYNYESSTEFFSIMQYIQYNYCNVTLSTLSKIFHYSNAHLSVLIKKNTGLNFKKLITKLKMLDASKYLKNTSLSIEKISELTGYNSSDHFSRAFKNYYSCSPQQYRHQNEKTSFY